MSQDFWYQSPYIDNGSSRIFSPSIAFRHGRSDCVSAGLGVEYARRSTTYIGDTRNESSITSMGFVDHHELTLGAGPAQSKLRALPSVQDRETTECKTADW